MPHRLALIAALALVLASFAASAQASDPLLSGYAGPGGGEQVVLGGGTVGKAKAKADAPLKAAPTQAAPVPAASAGESGGATSTLTTKPQRKKSSSSSSKDTGDDDAKPTATTTTATATTAGAPERVAYPTRAGEVGGLPVSATGVLLGVAAAVLVGLGLRRLAYADHDAEKPQGPAL